MLYQSQFVVICRSIDYYYLSIFNKLDVMAMHDTCRTYLSLTKMSGYQGSRLHAPTHAHQGSGLFVVHAQPHACAPTSHQGSNLGPTALAFTY